MPAVLDLSSSESTMNNAEFVIRDLIDAQFRKHIDRHEKPHRCEVKTCRRPFGVLNDRDRHMLAIHKIDKSTKKKKIYRCPIPHCKTKGKDWTRLDNFRSHLAKIHASESVDELLRSADEDAIQRRDGNGYVRGDLGHFQGNEPVSNSSPMCDAQSRSAVIPSNTSETLEAPDESIRLEDESDGDEMMLENASESHADETLSRGSAYLPSIHVPDDTFYEAETTLNLPPVDSFSKPLHSSHRLEAQRGERPEVTLPSKPSQQISPLQGPILHQPGTSPTRSNSAYSQGSSGAGDDQTTLHLIDQASREIAKMVTSMINKESIGRMVNVVDDPNKPRNTISRVNGAATQISSPAFGAPSNGQRVTDADLQFTGSDHIEGEIQRLAVALLNDKLILPRGRNEQPSSAPELPPHSRATKIKPVSCKVCRKVVPRPCDLRKHMMRHEKPYGCTYLRCTRTFGSKNDWKRHENSQHFQLDLWRCHPDVGSYIPKGCPEIFYRREKFLTHLQDVHGIHEKKTLDEEAKVRRIGRNQQDQFWCGFCDQIVTLQHRGLQAFDERFDHIGRHFGAGKRIDQWVPVDGKISQEQSVNSEKEPESSDSALPDQEYPYSGSDPSDDIMHLASAEPSTNLSIIEMEVPDHGETAPMADVVPEVPTVEPGRDDRRSENRRRSLCENPRVQRSARASRTSSERTLIRFCCRCESPNGWPYDSCNGGGMKECNGHQLCKDCPWEDRNQGK
ncbi:MAG: hypothetical protein M4579_000713 [Chaenotheca gracillima]|nr:MAG: hypothetical protein M4579_000713 [Chaenotheca gracillima]